MHNFKYSTRHGFKRIKITPDVTGGKVLWSHRQVEDADWYFVCPQKGEDFNGILDFRCEGEVELWDPVTGTSKPVESSGNGNRTSVKLALTCRRLLFRRIPSLKK